jgi:hypothetical protein
MGKLGGFILASLSLTVIVPDALAGIIHVTADNNSRFQVMTGPGQIMEGMTDAGGQGTMNLGTKAQEAAIGQVMVRKFINGKGKMKKVRLKPAGTTLASLEPFRFPTFDGPEGLIAIVEVDSQEGFNFSPGQMLTVSGGMITESADITFKDGASFGNVGFPTDAELAGLPDYNGSVTFFGYDFVVEVPEPSTFLLVLNVFGAMCALRIRPH